MLVQIEKEDYDHILNLLGRAKIEIVRLRSKLSNLEKDSLLTEYPQTLIRSFESFLDGPSHNPENSTIDNKLKDLINKSKTTVLEKIDTNVFDKIMSDVEPNSDLKSFVKQQDVIIKTNPDLPSIPMPNFDPLIFEGEKGDVAKEYNDPDTMEEIRKNYKHEGPITVVEEPDALAAAYNNLMAKLPQRDDDAMIHLKQKMSREEDIALEHAILKKQAKKEFWN